MRSGPRRPGVSHLSPPRSSVPRTPSSSPSLLTRRGVLRGIGGSTHRCTAIGRTLHEQARRHRLPPAAGPDCTPYNRAMATEVAAPTVPIYLAGEFVEAGTP